MHKMGSSKLHIEAVQTIVPSTVTDPRLTRKVSAANGPISSENLRGCLHLVLYYKASESDSGWSVAGFFKESLGMALTEQPFLAGRLRRGGDGEFEVVSNDSGARLVEAKMDSRLSEVLALEVDKREDVEANLVFWKEIDEQYPQFSPLFYVQLIFKDEYSPYLIELRWVEVTNFECGGYSVAISCSLVVADNVVVTKFLKNWANMHQQIMSQNDVSTLPIFYVPNMKRTGTSPTVPMNSSSSQTRGHTMMFKASIGQDVTSDTDFNKMLAWLCLDEVEHNLGRNVGSDITFFTIEAQEALKIETSCRREDRGLAPNSKSGITKVIWEDLGAKEMGFVKGGNPMHVSYWIRSISGGIVMAIPSYEKGSNLNVIVTFLKN